MSNNFLVTKEYLKFSEFCDECKKYCYIGLCYGTPGVGKTLSARRYSNWDILETILPPDHLLNPIPISDIDDSDSIFYTTPVNSSPVRIEREIKTTWFNLNWLIGDIIRNGGKKGSWDKQSNYTKLIIIDEADRLKPTSLEQIRDIYDTEKIAIVLIGMPGIEKKLSRYHQLYSRIGFVHNFKPISSKELEHVIGNKMKEFNIKCDMKDEYTKESFTEIIKITRGNFRLIQRLITQTYRIMDLNNIGDLSKDVVEAAKKSLITGTK